MRLLVLAASVAMATAQTTATLIGVTIDVTVLDGKGQSIRGLAAEDFSVQLDGQPRRVVTAIYNPTGAPMAGAVGPVFDAVTGATPIYRLVVQPQDGTTAGRDFAVAVNVNRAGATLQVPSRAAAAPISVTGMTRASAAPPNPAASIAERLRASIATGRADSGLPIAFGYAVRRGDDPARLTVDVQIAVKGSARPPLEALLGLVDARGGVRTATPQIEAANDGSFRVDLSLPVDAGSNTVRFAVADAANAMGSIDIPVTARLTPMGGWLASDLLRWTASGDARRPMLIRELPEGITAIGVTLELYRAAAASSAADLLVKVELTGGDTAVASIERIVTPEERGEALVADAEFPLARLGAGAYTIRATVSSASTVLGAVSTTFVKR